MLDKGTPFNDTWYQARTLCNKLRELDMGFTVDEDDVISSKAVPTLYIQVKTWGEANLHVKYVDPKEQGEWKIRRFKNEDSAVRFIYAWLNIPHKQLVEV